MINQFIIGSLGRVIFAFNKNYYDFWFGAFEVKICLWECVIDYEFIYKKITLKWLDILDSNSNVNLRNF